VPAFGAHKGATTESSSVFHLWQGFSIGAVVIGGFVTVLFVYAILRFRRKGDNIPRQAQYHLPAEVIYTVVPILVVFGLFAATLVVENKEVANPKANVTVDVNAFQWGWKFTYPHTETVVIGQTTQDPTMVIPVNTNVLREGLQLLALRPAGRAQPVHARSGQDRKLLRAVHAALRSLPFTYVLQREGRLEVAVHRVAGEHGEPRRLRRRSKDDGSTDGHAGSDQAGLEPRG